MCSIGLGFLACACGQADSDELGGLSLVHPSVVERVAAVGVNAEDVHFSTSLEAGELDFDLVSLCRVAWVFDGGSGLYRVATMTSVPEPVETSGYDRDVTTYVELRRQEAWSDSAPETLVLRVPGGDLPDLGLSARAHTAFDLGESVGLFWTNDTRSHLPGFNQGWPYTQNPVVFRSFDDELFAAEGVRLQPLEAGELGDLVRSTYASFGIPVERLVHEDPEAVPLGSCPELARGISTEAEGHRGPDQSEGAAGEEEIAD